MLKQMTLEWHILYNSPWFSVKYMNFHHFAPLSPRVKEINGKSRDLVIKTKIEMLPFIDCLALQGHDLLYFKMV